MSAVVVVVVAILVDLQQWAVAAVTMVVLAVLLPSNV